MSSLILMRHGQASFGANAYDQLSPIGIEQARISGAWIRERYPLYSIWYGPRRRHLNTAKEMLASSPEDLNNLHVSQGLDEFAEGEEVLTAASLYFDKDMIGPNAPSKLDQLRYYEQTISAWSRDNLTILGRDDYLTFRAYVSEWFSWRIGDRAAPSGRIELAITSAGVICAAICDVLDLPDSQWMSLMKVIKNASFTELVFSNGRCGLRSFNETGHLPVNVYSSI